MKQLAYQVLAVVMSPLSLCADEAKPPETPFVFFGKLSSLREDSTFLGKGWQGPSGLIVDDVSDTSSFQGTQKKTVDQLVGILRPKRILACADFTYNGKGLPLKIVTLRVFVFENTEAARAWWKQKYRGENASKYYKQVSGLGDDALDSTQLSKRIVMIGNCILTCHQLHKNGDYLRVLNCYLKKMRTVDRKDDKEG